MLGVARSVPVLYDRTADLCTNALGIIAALAWHSAIQELLDKSDLPVHSKLCYALVVTLVAALAASLMSAGGALVRGAESRVESIGSSRRHRAVCRLGHPSREVAAELTLVARHPVRP